MRALEGKQLRVRVVVGESDRWHHRPLHLALLERLRREGCAGTTVTRGIAGFGAHSVVYNAQVSRAVRRSAGGDRSRRQRASGREGEGDPGRDGHRRPGHDRAGHRAALLRAAARLSRPARARAARAGAGAFARPDLPRAAPAVPASSHGVGSGDSDRPATGIRASAHGASRRDQLRLRRSLLARARRGRRAPGAARRAPGPAAGDCGRLGGGGARAQEPDPRGVPSSRRKTRWPIRPATCSRRSSAGPSRIGRRAHRAHRHSSGEAVTAPREVTRRVATR